MGFAARGRKPSLKTTKEKYKMKKLMIALAAVAFATGLQAASVSWKATKQDALKGAVVYTFNGGDYAAVTALLAAGEAGAAPKSLNDAVLAYALEDENTGNKGITLSSTKGTGTAANALSGTTMFQIIFDDTITDGKTYKMTAVEDVSDFLYTPPETKPGDFAVLSTQFATTGTIGPGDVPEPTSAMLILLGVAGLALRRRA